MKILFYPYWRPANEAVGNLENFLSGLKLQIKHPDLWALVGRTIKKAKEPGGLEVLRESEYAGKLRNISEPLWEFRIPPKNRRGGVVRIYFCILKEPSERIVCLDAEFKKRVESSNQKIGASQGRYREIME
ncbi:MAG: hypothetical protein ABSG17_22670 [Spirochaetia bacterium]|jgi:hypothetical protein